uniref:Endonuclease/exonuclease/phosphatase domain-containing protein n=1 Tax=Chromera velia CCMP2878 TaxID=1169474 RepID=A0A0G4HHV1_9ALVE|eukprot:Cvel_27632.t1-p1 / transcript=Cvel_27632.t1 / gene=Cvel_27632 / organism=Chromera_velia_CCMP2878 / gene_product=Nocturnin, putative / transcript_product=Nocturnin, putative / location=Cvel_scaffold3477:4664-8688(-) / protein_length=336 / sequence_SO=supercontig / SO=protein_coding / is_pseudo=false
MGTSSSKSSSASLSPPLLDRKVTTVGGDGEASCRLTVLQWNVLAQAVCYKEDNFVECEEEHLTLEYRFPLVVAEILRCNPDVICLEEVDFFERLEESLGKEGFEGAFHPKLADKPEGPQRDGTAIFWKTSRLCLAVEGETKRGGVQRMRFSKEGEVACGAGGEAEREGKAATQGFLEVHLKGKDSDVPPLMVIATHLRAKEEHEVTRVVQVKQLIDHLKKVNPKRCFVCGDFNAPPESSSGSALGAEGQAEEGGGVLPLASLLTKDTAEALTYTTWKIRPKGEVKRVIDYIWYTGATLRPLSVLGVPTAETVPKCRFPHAGYPSDHLAVVAEFGVS